MFVPTWLIFLFSGTVMAILVLSWGINNHQFEDQDRARYLPLASVAGDELGERPSVRHGATYYVLAILLIAAPIPLILALSTILRNG